jgi:hypothetical protein
LKVKQFKIGFLCLLIFKSSNLQILGMSNNLLAGKKGIIFGALDEKSIAWKTALKCHEQGAQIVLSNAPVALRRGPGSRC